MDAPRIYADFHSADAKGNVRLNCVGTIEDLSLKAISLKEGLKLMLYSEGLEVEGVVHFSTDEDIWVAAIDWDNIRETALDNENESPLLKTA